MKRTIVAIAFGVLLLAVVSACGFFLYRSYEKSETLRKQCIDEKISAMKECGTELDECWRRRYELSMDAVFEGQSYLEFLDFVSAVYDENPEDYGVCTYIHKKCAEEVEDAADECVDDISVF